jgi:hypothetical protein
MIKVFVSEVRQNSYPFRFSPIEQNVNFILFFQFCDVGEVVYHPSDNLARFGYRLDMKVDNNQNPSIFLPTYLQFGNFFYKKKSITPFP